MTRPAELIAAAAATAAASARSVSIFGKCAEWRFISEYALSTRLPSHTVTPAAGAAGVTGIITLINQSSKSVVALITHEFNGRHIFSCLTIAHPDLINDCQLACAASYRNHYFHWILLNC